MARSNGICECKSRKWNLKKLIEDDWNLDNLVTFEEVIKENYNDTLIQDIWKLEQIVDNNCKSLTIAPSEGFWPLGLFRDKHSK